MSTVSTLLRTVVCFRVPVGWWIAMASRVWSVTWVTFVGCLRG